MAARKPITPESQGGEFFRDLFRAYINYENTGTTTKDFSSNSVTGVFSKGAPAGVLPNWGSDSDEGVYLEFGDRAFVICGTNPTVSLSDKFSVLVGFRLPDTEVQLLATRKAAGAATGAKDWGLYYNGSKLEFNVLNASASNVVVTSTETTPVDEWNVVAATYDGANISLHAPTKVSSAQTGDINTIAFPGGTTQNFQTSGGAAVGLKLSFLCIWNRVLTDSEIDQYIAEPYNGIWEELTFGGRHLEGHEAGVIRYGDTVKTKIEFPRDFNAHAPRLITTGNQKFTANGTPITIKLNAKHEIELSKILVTPQLRRQLGELQRFADDGSDFRFEIGRASCRERV